MFQATRSIFSQGLTKNHACVQNKTSILTRCFSSIEPREPVLNVEQFQQALLKHAPLISKSLVTQGFYATPEPFSVLSKEMITVMREQSINLRNEGRYEQSWSEKIDAVTGKVTRFDKQGVFACEPDGQDYDTAPDLILYMSVLLQTLPELLNVCQERAGDVNDDIEAFGLSMSSFNAKLAVTSPGGSVYPLHIDNPQGLQANDIRKLTCIIYLNPDYETGDGGELRIVSAVDEKIDIPPDGGRMVLFWSDEIPHEVLPTAPNADAGDSSKDRYALTLWIPTDNYQAIHNPRSKFSVLGDEVFSKNNS
ncbi:hypothetical protein CTEN210_12681 [Chaetoceros tenuissimus]|uniref:Fe2OG dioxygenase domain-containing protein n=1 Tax=Chaetoceros tenuissimus TaxID=426638 RepID=A0AAD3D3V2_9STRA|nr:hypothetical protein CTEN210_12681 [Chaetoceros tenuissimus]